MTDPLTPDTELSIREKCLATALERHPGDDEAAMDLAARLLRFMMEGSTTTNAPRPPTSESRTSTERSAGRAGMPADRGGRHEDGEEDADEASPGVGPGTSSPEISARPDDLSPRQYAVWREFAEAISETGTDPTQINMAKKMGLPAAGVRTAVQRLVRKGYLRRTGTTKTLLIHVTKWPEGITPRPTERRAPTLQGRRPRSFPPQDKTRVPAEEINAWLESNEINRDGGVVYRAIRYVDSRGGPKFTIDRFGNYRRGHQAIVTPEGIVNLAKKMGFDPDKPDDPGIRDEKHPPPEIHPTPAQCTEPGCKNTPQPGRDICAQCNAVQLAMRPRHYAPADYDAVGKDGVK